MNPVGNLQEKVEKQSQEIEKLQQELERYAQIVRSNLFQKMPDEQDTLFNVAKGRVVSAQENFSKLFLADETGTVQSSLQQVEQIEELKKRNQAILDILKAREKECEELRQKNEDVLKNLELAAYTEELKIHLLSPLKALQQVTKKTEILTTNLRSKKEINLSEQENLCREIENLIKRILDPTKKTDLQLTLEMLGKKISLAQDPKELNREFKLKELNRIRDDLIDKWNKTLLTLPILKQKMILIGHTRKCMLEISALSDCLASLLKTVRDERELFRNHMKEENEKKRVEFQSSFQNKLNHNQNAFARYIKKWVEVNALFEEVMKNLETLAPVEIDSSWKEVSKTFAVSEKFSEKHLSQEVNNLPSQVLARISRDKTNLKKEWSNLIQMVNNVANSLDISELNKHDANFWNENRYWMSYYDGPTLLKWKGVFAHKK